MVEMKTCDIRAVHYYVIQIIVYCLELPSKTKIIVIPNEFDIQCLLNLLKLGYYKINEQNCIKSNL